MFTVMFQKLTNDHSMFSSMYEDKHKIFEWMSDANASFFFLVVVDSGTNPPTQSRN